MFIHFQHRIPLLMRIWSLEDLDGQWSETLTDLLIAAGTLPAQPFHPP
jgi:hypothetical protein